MSSGCGCKEVYIDFLILLIPTLHFFAAALFCSFKKMFFVLVPVHF